MSSIKQVLSIEPVYHTDGDYYTPSPASLSVMVWKKSGYKKVEFSKSAKAPNNKILVLCVDEHFLVMGNGKKFYTGNHPVEMFVPLMHLSDAGFEPVFATLSGQSCKLEEENMPTDDKELDAYRALHQKQLDQPKVIKEVVSELENGEYQAVFIPGGHGAIIGLPESKDVQKVLEYFIKKDRYIISICHGPSALLSLTIDKNYGEFPFRDFKFACFDDNADKMAQGVGYLPGPMPFGFSHMLQGLCMDVVSPVPMGITHVDRKLITGDSPLAANKLGVLACKHLLGIDPD